MILDHDQWALNCEFVIFFVCLVVRTKEMSAQMELQKINLKKFIAEDFEPDTSNFVDNFATYWTTLALQRLILGIRARLHDQ